MVATNKDQLPQPQPKETLIEELREKRAAYLQGHNLLIEGDVNLDTVESTKAALREHYVEPAKRYYAALGTLAERPREEALEIFLKAHPEYEFSPDLYPDTTIDEKKAVLMTEYLYTDGTEHALHGYEVERAIEDFPFVKRDEAQAPFETELELAKFVKDKPNNPLTIVLLAEKGIPLKDAQTKDWEKRSERAAKILFALSEFVAI